MDNKAVSDSKKGWFDKLFESFSRDVKVTGLVILTITNIYWMRKADATRDELAQVKDQMRTMIVTEVRARVKQETAPIKEVVDSTKARVDSSTVKTESFLQKLDNTIKKRK